MFELGIAIIFLFLGFFFGRRNEKNHLKELDQRESELSFISIRTDQGLALKKGEVILVTGSVVVASDYFKEFVGKIKSIFGGRLKTHESLLQRARREAILRMKENAKSKNANKIIDVHIETSFLSQSGVEVSAYGTGIRTQIYSS